MLGRGPQGPDDGYSGLKENGDPMRLIWAVLSVLILASPAFAEDKAPLKFAVMDLEAGRDVDKAVAHGLSELAMAEIQGRHLGECIGSSDIKSLLSLEQQKQLLACSDDASCVAEIGGALGVGHMVTGGISRIGSKYLVSLKLFDVRKVQVLARLAEQVPADEDSLLNGFPDMIGRLFAQSELSDEPGLVTDLQLGEGDATLVVRSDPGGSKVFLAGRSVGLTPLRLEKLPEGRYEIQIQHRDYATYIDQLSISKGQEHIVEKSLAINPELAWRNYEFARKRFEDEAQSNTFWGVTHTAAGGLVGVIGALVALGGAKAGAGVLTAGLLVTGLGVGWAGYGVVKLLNGPEAPARPDVKSVDNTKTE